MLGSGCSWSKGAKALTCCTSSALFFADLGWYDVVGYNVGEHAKQQILKPTNCSTQFPHISHEVITTHKDVQSFPSVIELKIHLEAQHFLSLHFPVEFGRENLLFFMFPAGIIHRVIFGGSFGRIVFVTLVTFRFPTKHGKGTENKKRYLDSNVNIIPADELHKAATKPVQELTFCWLFFLR